MKITHSDAKLISLQRFCKLAIVVLLCLSTSVVIACPFCSAPSLTLTQQIDQSDVVVLSSWQSSKRGTADVAGETELVVTDIVKNEGKPLQTGNLIKLARFRSGKEGQLMVLMGTQGEEEVEWDSPIEVNELSYNYMAQAPHVEAPDTERLAYFLKFLEFPDELVASDAYAEFAGAPYDEIVKLKKLMPRKKLQEWVSTAYAEDEEKQIQATALTARLGLYGLMLGLSGNEQDGEIMRELIARPSNDFRLGIDGVMAGYLLLKGEEGLELLEETKLTPEKKIPFSETYAAMQAIRFMWNDAKGQIPKERLRKSMRILLDRNELADLVIADLARWKDWSVQEKLFNLYGTEGYTIAPVKRAIVRFLLASIKDGQKSEDAERAASAEQAAKFLEQLREKDPKTVEQSERFFIFD